MVVALLELDLELDAPEERRGGPERDAIEARLERVGEPSRGRRRRSAARQRRRRRGRPSPRRRGPAVPHPCRGRGSRARSRLESSRLEPMEARDLVLVGTGEGAVVDDELAADVQPLDPVRRREDEAVDRDRRRRRARARRVDQTARSAHLPGAMTPMSSRASTSAPPRVASRSASREVSAVGPPRARATSSACLTSKQRSLRSFEAEPSTPRPTRTPASSIARTGAMPAPSRRFEVGQCATPVPVEAKRPTSASGEVDAVRAPDVACRATRGRPGTRRASSRSARGRTPPPRPSRRGACGAGGRAPARAQPTRASGRRSPRRASTARPRAGRARPGSASCRPARRRVSSRMASIVSTTESGGRPPCDSPRSIEPREATRRTPSSRAAWSSASISPCSPCGKT